MDHVDKILAQWASERPDLDTGPMGLLGRLGRLRTHLGREVEAEIARHGLNSSSFDVLATLRRSGQPYRLTVSDLLAAMMVTSGTMTNRLDQLEKAGLIERRDNPEDRRGVLVVLTDKGFDMIDKAVTAHVANQHRLVEALSVDDRATLDILLKKFLSAFE
ncbi:DNA-binding MarR family transcriptional regulator [Rhizobium sp. SG_E_25_P2]|jgi:DNA-binding MarR family transcriptional regulator|uniref:MarR family winged helix-turn-helix transcriptional regulator n=1 Tax=Rhizobium sp. SG_E_25_P2 TaxID=2879942 RepID=UPI00247622EF|nr:MarR family transcriptional regulator [Rhizobium sp. SG_E_25_P2]MDH6265310.1 DNA-binding MarR family transcriptional regulator [Rhizobium sp. SG_E_25_P2]